MEFNEGVFGGALSGVEVTWSPRLHKTAGVTKSFRRTKGLGGGWTYVSAVELSTKVVDSEAKLREVMQLPEVFVFARAGVDAFFDTLMGGYVRIKFCWRREGTGKHG